MRSIHGYWDYHGSEFSTQYSEAQSFEQPLEYRHSFVNF